MGSRTGVARRLLCSHMKRPWKAQSRVVPILMALSLAVLVGFCSQWVYSQYEREKDRLHEDLTTVYELAVRETMDSLLLRNVLNPMLQERKAMGLLPRKDMKIVVSRDMKYSVGKKPDSVFSEETS